MSETENSLDSRRLSIAFIIAGIIILGGFSGAVGIGGSGSAICSTATQPCVDQITFDTAVIANSTGNDASLKSPGLSMTNTEGIIVASLGEGGFVTSVVDTLNDNFARNLRITSGGFPQQILELWSAFYTGPSGAINAVTVNWNFTAPMMFFVSTYRNAVAVGNSTGTTGLGTVSLTMETLKSGSAIVGASSFTGVGAGTVPTCGALSPIPGTGQIQRIAGCSGLEAGSPPGFATNGDLEDNLTALPNTTFVTYSTTAAASEATNTMILGAVELIGRDTEPKNPNFNNFCTTVNALCVTTQYTLNSVRMASGANTLNQVLTLGQVYCTGITTSALTTSKTDTVLMTANYGGVSLNQTGAKMLVQLKEGTTAPSTVFGSGVCASGGNVVGTMDLTFTLSGSLSATNAYSNAVNGSPSLAAGTYFAWLEITPQNFVGHMSYDQVVNQAYCFANIFMQEQK